MEQLKSVVDILKILDKSNCSKCREPTCMAFAAKVFSNQRKLDECPALDRKTVERYAGKTRTRPQPGTENEQTIVELKRRVQELDLASRAQELGAVFSGEKLCLKVMGKNFCVDKQGRLITDIHANPWVAGPILDFIIHGKGTAPTGEWVGFRELEGGRARYGLFHQRGEAPMKMLADASPGFFTDLLEIFSGKQVENHLGSDISIVLWPLPKTPLLLCYWKAEEGVESDLLLFFDKNINKNLRTDSVFTVCAGMAAMFTKLALRHGQGGSPQRQAG